MKAFMAALESMGKDPLEIGQLPPTPDIVNKGFNDSTGEDENGEKDFRGPWNEDGVEYLEVLAQTIASGRAETITREVFKGSENSSFRANSDRKIRKC